MTSGPPQGGPPPGGWGPPPGGGGAPPPSPPPGQPGQPWQPPPGERRNPLAVLGGIVLGLGLGFLVMPWLGIMLSSTAVGSTDSSSAETLSAVGIFLGFGLPILLGIAMLVPRRLRKAGAGVLLGLSIGMIVGSASCLGIWGLFIAALSGAH